MTEPAPEKTDEQNPPAQVDSAFAQAWNEVFGEEDKSQAPADPAATPDPGTGAPTTDAPVVTPGSEPAPTGEPGAGATATPATGTPDPGQLPAGEGDQQAAAAGQPAAGTPSPWGGEPQPFADIAPLFDAASANLIKSSEEALREQAVEEINKQLDPTFLQMLQAHPMELVGNQVPNVNGQEGVMRLNNAAEAEAWLGAVKQILGRQVNARTEALLQDARPILSTLQGANNLFKNNPDLVPGTKEYNPELAKQVYALTKTYIHKVDDKAIGFRVDIQPVVDAVREQLKTAAPAPTARQEQAAQQARTPTGQFDAPQAGIPSQAGISGDPEEDYDPFWKAVGRPGMTI